MSRIVIIPDGKLSRVEREALQPIFLGQTDKLPCQDCGGLHEIQCPRVKRKAWHGNGNPAEVEYWQAGEWDDSQVIWPQDVFEESE